VHVAHWGVLVSTTRASIEGGSLSVLTRVENESAAPARVTVETQILDRGGKPVGHAQSAVEAAPGSATEASQEIAVSKPALWSPEAPALYRAVSRIREGGKVLDEVETPFGIRSLAWSAETGLLLNGKPVKLTGGSVHHDNGPLGAAAFDRAEERRVEH
jgi:beta-galactosidase